MQRVSGFLITPALLAVCNLAVGEVERSPREKLDPMDQPLVTDRPDFTESTEAVPPGHFQLEVGYTFTTDREDGISVREHAFPQTLLRIGLFDDLELRLGWNGYAWSQESSKSVEEGQIVRSSEWVQGGGDISVGFKLKLWEQEGLLPHFGFIGEITTPAGSPNQTSGDVDPAVKLLWAYDLSDSLAIAGNINFASLTEDRERFVQAAASLSLAVALNDTFGTYVEYFGEYPISEGRDAAHVLNGGVTCLVHKDLQLDLLAGVGLNEAADDYFIGLGFSWRH